MKQLYLLHLCMIFEIKVNLEISQLCIRDMKIRDMYNLIGALYSSNTKSTSSNIRSIQVQSQ